jgi:hypothetical protein
MFSSAFDPALPKAELYGELAQAAEALIGEETDALARRIHWAALLG